jgi:hypothetical protein
MQWFPVPAAVLLLLAQIIQLPNLSTHRTVRSEVDINASPAAVWAVLTDLADYSIWNPYIYPAEGQVTVGAELVITLHQGKDTTTYSPTVRSSVPNHGLVWEGRFGSLLERTQTITITEIAPGRVQVDAVERFTGVLLPLAQGIPDGAQVGLDMMLRALRDRVELLNITH